MSDNPNKRPVLLLDKAGRPFFITEGDLSFLDPLLHMYFCFTPRPNIQGLPPKDQKSCETWAAGLLSKGINIIALRPDNTVIGHVSLLPSLDLRDAEYMIFVHQGHRLLGIGTQLTLQAIDKARSLGIKRLWLCVSSTNIPAIRLYLKVGFSFRSKGHDECVMELLLD